MLQLSIIAILFVPLTSLYAAVQVPESDISVVKFGVTRKNEVNVRNGPGKEYKVLWKFIKAGVPMEILHNLDDWYLIRDYTNSVGWIRMNFISTRIKNAIVVLDKVPMCRLPVNKMVTCHVVAYLERNVLLRVKYCNKRWCHVIYDESLSGWIERRNLWGIDHKRHKID